MLTTFGILFLILESIFLIFIVAMILFRKRIFDKETIILTIPTFLILFLIYLVGAIDSGEDFTFYSFFNVITNSLDAFKFEAKTSSVAGALENPFYNASLIVGVLLAGLSLVFSVLGFFSVSIVNFHMVNRRMKKEVDIVIGYNEESIQYCKRNAKDHRVILFINSSCESFTKDDKNKLYSLKIPYIFKNFKPSYFKKRLLLPKKINFIYLGLTKDLHFVYDFLDEIGAESKLDMIFHILVDQNSCNFVSSQVTSRCVGKPHLTAYVFNKHELIARAFSIKENFAKYLPREFFDGVTIKKDRKVVVNIIGYGKTGEAVLKSLIMNNQFVTKVKDKYECFQVEYNIYDINEQRSNNSLFNFINKYSDFIHPKEVPAPEIPCIIKAHKLDINRDYLDIKYAENENEFYFTFVCLDKTISSCTFVNNLKNRINMDKNVIFYNVDFTSEIFINDKNIIPFGFKSHLLSHELIINDSFGLLAKLSNKAYWDLKQVEEPEEFHALPLIQKLSNIYADINIRFKLNLLGLDYSKKPEGSISKEKFEEYFKAYTYKNYEEYLVPSLNNALAVQEHLRWNAFYLLNGFITMEPSEFYFNEKKVINKLEDSKKHGCLTTYYGLDKVHKAVLNLYKKNNIDRKLFLDVETYRFDSSLMNNIYDLLMAANYHIIVKKDA